MDDKVKAAIKRAVDWLEANPDKHIKSEMAITKEGYRVKPNSPHAECFCAGGRIAKELDMPVFPNIILCDAGISPVELMVLNDQDHPIEGVEPYSYSPNGRRLSGPDAIEYLKEALK